jgi:acetyltransferase
VGIGTSASQTEAAYVSSPGYGLNAFFTPKAVAVIGATERLGSVGRTVLVNVSQGTFKGKVYAVNPKHKEVCGVPAFSSIRSVPGTVDLAIVVTPASTVPDIINECVLAGVRACVVISADFRERGREGAELENQIRGNSAPAGCG